MIGLPIRCATINDCAAHCMRLDTIDVQDLIRKGNMGMQGLKEL